MNNEKKRAIGIFSFADAPDERHEMMLTAGYWIPIRSMDPLNRADRVTLENGTIVKDRGAPLMYPKANVGILASLRAQGNS